MVKSVLAVFTALLCISTTTLSAQTTDSGEPHAAVQVSFFPPLSTNGFRSGAYTNDFSFNILAGVSKNERALAFAGLANVIRNDASGLQFAGLANYVGNESKGLQFAGLFNTAAKVTGFQFAGLANLSTGKYSGVYDVKGFQFAGLVNKASDVSGSQFAGLVNVAKNVSGFQFAGLVNIADHSDYPIGLVNIIKDGEMGVAAGYNELGTMSLTFRSGGRVLYGIVGLGYNHKVDRSKDAAVAIGGLGAHINITDWLRINNELTTESMDCFSTDDDDSNAFKSGYALLPAFRIGQHLELFGGPSINYMRSKNTDMFDLFPNHSLWDKKSATEWQQVYIGWQAGIQVIF